MSDFNIENDILVRYYGKDRKVKVPSGITSIGEYAFMNCHEIESIKLPNSLKRIGSYAFTACNFSSISIPDSVSFIGDYCFRESYLREITLPKSITLISPHLFEKSYISKIVIPEGVKEIGYRAFYSCYSLQYIEIPKSLKVVNLEAIPNVKNINVIYHGTKKDWKKIWFKDKSLFGSFMRKTLERNITFTEE